MDTQSRLNPQNVEKTRRVLPVIQLRGWPVDPAAANFLQDYHETTRECTRQPGIRWINEHVAIQLERSLKTPGLVIINVFHNNQPEQDQESQAMQTICQLADRHAITLQIEVDNKKVHYSAYNQQFREVEEEDSNLLTEKNPLRMLRAPQIEKPPIRLKGFGTKRDEQELVQFHAYLYDEARPVAVAIHNGNIEWTMKGELINETQTYITTMGKTFKITGSFLTDEEANNHCAENPETAVIHTDKQGIIHCAKIKAHI